MCHPTRAYLRHVANTIELVLPWPTKVHNPNDKSIGSAVFAQLTVESPYNLQRAPVSPKIAPFHGRGDLGPIQFMIPWVSTSPQPIRHHHRFSRFCTDDRRVSLYFTREPLPLKIAPSHGDVDPHLIMVPWAHPSPQPKLHLDRFSRFCRAH